MRTELRPAYILHRQPYRETSLLLEAFSLDVGRIGLVARGARSGKGAGRGLLQPFVPLLLSWSGRGELATLTGVEGRGGLAPLGGRALISAFYLNELLLRLLQRHDPHDEVFHAYELALTRLAAVPQQPEWTLRLFEKALLQELGYGLLLEREAHSGAAIQAETRYCYHVQQGPLPEAAGSAAGPCLHGTTLLALAAEAGADERVLAEAKTLMRTILAQYLGPRPLRSRELFRQTFAGRTAEPPPHDEEQEL